MDISFFDYDLPDGYIAYYPARQRDLSRLMIVNRETGEISHGKFPSVINYMKEGDGLIVNDTKVFKARLIVRRKSGGKVEVFLLEEVKYENKNCWKVLTHPSRRVKEDEELMFNDSAYLRVVKKLPDGKTIIRFNSKAEAKRLTEKFGQIPLPIYIHREYEKRDEERYQTIFAKAKNAKAVAAPTAGLHFSSRNLKRIKAKGIEIIPITLNVGFGTFKTVKVNDIDEHSVDAEFAEISAESADQINKVRKNGGKLFVVGTTSVRTIESAEMINNEIQPFSGYVNTYIKPGYEFKFVDHLITNFHLPKSSLMFLVSALAGREKILEAYNLAVKEKYRFYSYGDCMLIF